jgi:hypothetical protein
VTSGAGGASGVSRTETGQKNEAMARADGMESLVPSPIEIDPLGLESMEAMESIQVPTLTIARIEVAAIAEE